MVSPEAFQKKSSFKRRLLRTAQELLPEDMALEIYDIANNPFYNEDVMAAGIPETVKDFEARIAAADDLRIATPEYNYSIPGVLKNAIDWASRPAKESPLNDKPIAIIGTGARTMLDAFRESGSSLLTLGFALVVGLGRTALTFVEAALEMILMSLLIAYLPTMYSAFSRREAAVTRLEVRAGDPISISRQEFNAASATLAEK